ncbi:hypothetical protein [Chishuiella sp.]|uniref:hypothetical protein n=1 Tax=Chishuiella sp. TaxID=1969467 RepID=UPI0028A6E8A5|nr:hypothetical protein [Chishuiella sp.]
MLTNNEYFEKAIDTFTFGFILLAIYLAIYYFSKSKKKNIPIHNIQKKKPYEYVNESTKILQKGRMQALLLISIIFLISSVIYFILSIYK